MCGRFTMAIDAEQLQMKLNLGTMPELWEKRYNIAPSQYIATVPFADSRNVVYMRWGLV
ncbi:MAG: SOS response-associated peptidase, partial [Chloroflexi bacterium]|nr:SOS response-associated peptidase [Chloroflexota bacterium]